MPFQTSLVTLWLSNRRGRAPFAAGLAGFQKVSHEPLERADEDLHGTPQHGLRAIGNARWAFGHGLRNGCKASFLSSKCNNVETDPSWPLALEQVQPPWVDDVQRRIRQANISPVRVASDRCGKKFDSTQKKHIDTTCRSAGPGAD